jgi:hypothetical protein
MCPLKVPKKNLCDRSLCSFEDLLYGPKRMLRQSLIRFDFREIEQFPVQNRKFDRVYLAPFSSYAAHIRAFDGTFAPYRPAKFGACSCNGYRDIAVERFFKGV